MDFFELRPVGNLKHFDKISGYSNGAVKWVNLPLIDHLVRAPSAPRKWAGHNDRVFGQLIKLHGENPSAVSFLVAIRSFVRGNPGALEAAGRGPLVCVRYGQTRPIALAFLDYSNGKAASKPLMVNTTLDEVAGHAVEKIGGGAAFEGMSARLKKLVVSKLALSG